MPPPPPPSKSYLIKFDDSDLSSDDDDDDDNYYRQQQQRFQPIVVTPPTTSSGAHGEENSARIHHETDNGNGKSVFRDSELWNKPEPVTRKDTPETVSGSTEDDDDDDDDSYEDGTTAAEWSARKAKRNKKKKQNKKRNKKQAKTAATAAAVVTPAAAAPPKVVKRIHFSNVEVISLDRCLGTGVVPLDGGWPLGLGQVIPVSGTDAPSTTLSLDDYETAKYARLVQRWKYYKGPNTEEEEEQPPAILETRQMDYKSKTKNPLFGLLIERERMVLLLGEDDLDEVLQKRYAKEQAAKEKKPKSSSPNGGKNSGPKPRNNSNGGGAGGKSPSSSNRHRSGTGSRGGGSFMHQQQERYNDIFTEYEVHHVRNELEQYRNQRTQEGNRGCTCRRLDVYIPPPGAGKKAAHRRLSPQKVKEELRKRHLLPENSDKMTREDLELLLAQIVATEPCCRDDNQCPCVKNGIGCQSDACQCWHASHQVKTTHHNNNKSTETVIITPTVIRDRCGNKHGMSTVDPDAIDDYRKPFLTATYYCQPVHNNNNNTMMMMETTA